MVGGVAGGGEFLKGATGGPGGLPHGVEKLFSRDVGGTRAGDQHAPGRKMINAQAGQAGVGAQGTRSLLLAPRQRWRVEHNEAKVWSRVFAQPFERIGLNGVPPAIGYGWRILVQLEIAPTRSQGVSA